MPRALIITYYWPPAGGGGVQRWLKFSKFMREYSWEPVIFTPENPELAGFDESLIREVPTDLEVLKVPIWEPFDLYKKILGKGKGEKIQPGFLQESGTNTFLQRLSVWIRGNLFIPDAKRFWIKPSVKFLLDYLDKNEIDVIISTGPPHTNHLIARAIKRKLDIRWLADFRDPWTNIDYYEKLKLTKRSNRIHQKMERSVFTEADEVVTVSWSWAIDFQSRTGILPKVITNGYDEEDFKDQNVEMANQKLTITHIGSLNADRNPHSLWKAMAELNEDGKLNGDVVIELIGPTDVTVFESVRGQGLDGMVKHIANMPHREVITKLCASEILLLPLNDTPNIDGVIPGKLYEYLASKRPILAIGKTSGDSAKILEECQAGKIFDFNDVEGLKNYLVSALQQHKKGGLPATSMAPEKYSRKQLTTELCRILDGLVQS